MMKLIGFQVTDFRSVGDSGWIEADNVTALIGVNESGKTNLLVPLWKLNPAKDGEINAIADYPRKRYSDFRAMEDKPNFIAAKFELGDELAARIASITDVDIAEVRTVLVERDFDDNPYVSFP